MKGCGVSVQGVDGLGSYRGILNVIGRATPRLIYPQGVLGVTPLRFSIIEVKLGRDSGCQHEPLLDLGAHSNTYYVIYKV